MFNIITPAARTENITYAIRDLVVKAQQLEKQGRKILYLNIGDPCIYDFKPPEHLWQAVWDNKDKSNSYADSMGLKEAREAIAAEAVRKGISGTTSDDVLVSTGGSEGILFALGALINPGEHFLTPSPGYPLYDGLIPYFGCGLRTYDLDEENNWQLDLDSIRSAIDEKTRGLVVINPNNPTGSVLSKKTVMGLIDIAAEHNLVIFSDEIYDKMYLDEEQHITTASLTDEVPVVTIGGISKNYLAPGWRIGWLIFSGNGMENYREGVNKIARARLSSSHPMQYAIKPALEGPQSHIAEMNRKLRERRDFTYKRLNEIEGISCVKPKAAFYAFPRIDLKIDDDEKFILDFLEKENVLFVHGDGFGQKQGTHHFRVVYLPQPDVLEEAYNRLERFVKGHM